MDSWNYSVHVYITVESRKKDTLGPAILRGCLLFRVLTGAHENNTRYERATPTYLIEFNVAAP